MKKYQTTSTKTPYTPPLVQSYKYAELLRRLGPARAYSHNMSTDDEFLLFGVVPSGK